METVKRLTIVEHAYFESPAQHPTCVEAAWSRLLATDEQPFTRRFMVGSDWIPLPTGWLERCSMLLLKNEGESTAFVGISDPLTNIPIAVLPKGETLRFQPTDLKSLACRFIKGEGFLVVTLFPE